MSRNIVFIVLDSVRKDFFEQYAHRLKEKSDVIFEQCRAASAWSVPSHASIFTGLLPSSHGVHTHDPDFSMIENDFISNLTNHNTYGVSANFYASSEFGFDSLFDEFTEVAPHKRFPDGMNLKEFSNRYEEYGIRFYTDFLRNTLQHENTIQSLSNGVIQKVDNLTTGTQIPSLFDDGADSICNRIETISKKSNEPFFVFANIMDAHGPHENNIHYNGESHDVENRWHSSNFDNWDINNSDDISVFESDIKKHRSLYAAAIEYLDRRVSDTIEKVSEMAENETTYIITSDHGENLGYQSDEYLVNHTSSLSESILHVPLMIVNPPGERKFQEKEYFSQLDLGDLIGTLADGNLNYTVSDHAPSEVVGVSGSPEIDTDFEFWDRAIRAVYDGQKKTVWDSQGRVSKYEIKHIEPCWQREIESDATIPDFASELFGPEISSFKSEAKNTNSKQTLNQDSRERLEDLGYI